ncbi:MAG: glycosyltransferase family 4 protein [Hyphomicrobiaceae bacterium]|nr:glycosyltransferase family 4 protein [Hyphomicrobiaceae bacterium]
MRRRLSPEPTLRYCVSESGILTEVLPVQTGPSVPQHRPTILQIIPRLDTGGAERTTIEMTQAIVTAGGRALVATGGGRMAAQVTRAGGEVIPLNASSKNPLTMLANARRLSRIARRESVDLLHARSRAPAWSALIAARSSGRPLVTTYHGAYAEHGALKRAYNSVMARGDAVIANSRYTARLIEGRYGTPPDRIRVIHRGIDEESFDPDLIEPERVERLRAGWGVRPNQRVLLHAARLTSWKGQAVVVAAAARLVQQTAPGDWVVILAGDAQGRLDYADDLEQQIAAHGLGDRVRLVGHVDDMPAAYLAAHVAVVASTAPEAFGRAAAEAEAMRCPVIATAIGAAPETVIAAPSAAMNEITGWLVPPGDSVVLAHHMGAALELSDAERRAIGERARSHVSRSFSLAAMQAATLDVYDGLLGTRLADAWAAARSSRSRAAGA